MFSRRSMFCLPLLALAPIEKTFAGLDFGPREARVYFDHNFSHMEWIDLSPPLSDLDMRRCYVFRNILKRNQ